LFEIKFLVRGTGDLTNPGPALKKSPDFIKKFPKARTDTSNQRRQNDAIPGR
jgi:hypothetical protein